MPLTTKEYVHEGISQLSRSPICRVRLVEEKEDVYSDRIGKYWSWDVTNLQPYYTIMDNKKDKNLKSFVLCTDEITIDDIDMKKTIESNRLGNNTESEFILKSNRCFNIKYVYSFDEFQNFISSFHSFKKTHPKKYKHADKIGFFKKHGKKDTFKICTYDD